MALEDYESSRALGAPVDLYYFRYGSDPAAFYAYTDAEIEVEHAGVTYAPHPLKRGKVTSSQSLDKSELKVRTTLASPLAELFRIGPPSSVVTVVIRRGHVTDVDNEFMAVFVGRVSQCKREGREAELSCVPASTSMKRSGLRRHYQLTCPHVLYDQDDGSCKASMAAATTGPVLASAVAYTAVVLPAAWFGALDPRKFIGGMVVWAGPSGTERKTIIRMSSDGLTLTLNGATTGLAAGAPVSVILGCNHQTSDCEDLHNNILNFGGMPYIPSENPVKTNPFS